MDEYKFGYIMRPQSLRLDHVGLIPLQEAISRASRIGTDRVAGRECDIYLFSAEPGTNGTRDLLYHLDTVTSIPLKVESFADEGRRKAAEPSWVWEATSFDEVQGFHVALSSRYTSFVVRERSSPIRQLTDEYKITTLKYNEKYDASLFWPTYDYGVQINDLIARKAYYNTPDKKAPSGPATNEATVAANRLIAAQPSDSTAWYAGGGVLLGCILLVSGATLWMRNR